MKQLSELLGITPDQKQTCPRRIENISGTLASTLGEDHWRRWGCSYCGSMPPDDFMQAIAAGSPLGPTDKNYKVYIDWPGGVKFYFQHLSEDQMMEFVELHNTDQLAFQYPGHFPVLPYFMGRPLLREMTD